MKLSKKNRSIKIYKNKGKNKSKNKNKNSINMYKTCKNKSNKSNKSNKNKKGGAKQEILDPKKMESEIGRVPFSRLERRMKEQIEYLKKIRNNCAASCKTESCFYNNKENCDALNEMMKTENDLSIGKYCAKKFQNISCTKFGTLHEKIKFFLNYIDTVNKNCHNLMDEYEKSSQFKENEKLFV
jgi:hypothetical protein